MALVPRGHAAEAALRSARTLGYRSPPVQPVTALRR